MGIVAGQLKQVVASLLAAPFAVVVAGAAARIPPIRAVLRKKTHFPWVFSSFEDVRKAAALKRRKFGHDHLEVSWIIRSRARRSSFSIKTTRTPLECSAVMSSDHAGGPVGGFNRSAYALFAVHIHNLDIMRRCILPDRFQLAGETVAFHLPFAGNPEVCVSP
jgi:hypothetical protein